MTDRRHFLRLGAATMLAMLPPRPAAAILAADVRLIYEEIAGERSPLVTGNAAGMLPIIYFFDYQSTEGRVINALLQRLAAGDSNIRILCKEWPRPGSLGELASRAAIAAHWQGGYAVAHAALMRVPGDLDERRIVWALRDAGLDMRRLFTDLRDRFVDIERRLRITGAQARDLGLVTRPALVGGATRLLPPVTDEDVLRLIENARHPQT